MVPQMLRREDDLETRTTGDALTLEAPLDGEKIVSFIS